ncbi:hypothetical protein [Bacteroides caecimuris]|jgi:hypothetical protein|uniref:Uncharacterized protein n=1 Tax=Bacteroides caecimuris TaxID=1796613 RepID=A0A1C7H4V6_9BACE|nr:hypothetical protein [Bacteroides caecimuris]ANU59564.1 hypothetical protein A4V03_19955 [Bacteroides caecimuris]NDO61850.1 hypothetical protein [Bacteroides caecimuris]OXE63589.1 hypothetical protein ADH74_11705 [Bacteroides caecimuris]QQR19040.1 hypothetical protein I5Q79_09305 [Bacteroides caecimuris]UQA32073.1 hypothetical protein M2854_09395 [Bacteroides caecimuris]
MKKNYKIILLFCLLLGGMLSDASAKRKNSFVRKDEIFSYYSKFVSEVWDISWKKPKGFTDLMKSETWAFGKKDPYSLFYRLTVESVDKDCLIMYPELKMVTSFPDIAWTEKCGKPEFLRNYVMMEVGDSLIEERLTVFSGTEASMNADTVFVFRTALKNVYKRYSYCTSIYAYKEGRPPMIFRCFFTEKGRAKEKLYLSKFYKSVNYGNNKEWKMDADKMREASSRIFYSFTNAERKGLFSEYQVECERDFHIKLSMPAGFETIDKMVSFRVNEGRNIGVFYSLLLESRDKDCLMLYPLFIENQSHGIAKNMTYGEVKAALNLAPEENECMRMNLVNGKFTLGKSKVPDRSKETVQFDTARYMRVIAEENMENYCNADTVYVYEVPLLKPYKGVYTKCIGINMVKEGHPYGMAKILLMEGDNAKDKYMKQFFESIRYSDSMLDYKARMKSKNYKKK